MHLKSRVILGVATAGAAIGAVLVPASSAMAATPTLTVTQNAPTGLNEQSGDTVTVVGSGYTPSATIALVLCSSVKPDGTGCDQSPADARLVPADANGGFTVNDLVVTTGVKGTDGVSCGAGSQCFVAGANIAQQTEVAADDFLFDNLQISPRTNLKNGSVVNLVGANYKPSTPVYVSECNSTDKATALQHCDTNAVQTFTSDANGKISGQYTVRTPIQASEAGPFSCAAGKQCVIAGTDNIASPGTGNIGGAVVTFAPAAALKPLSVSAHSSKKHVAKGKAFKISGKAISKSAGVKGLKVVLDKIKGGAPSKVASGKTGTGGAYSFKLSQKKTTKYVVVIAKQKGYKAAVSKTVKVSTP
jgi:hypothetical protein